jgi:hypothetical protein
MKTLYALILALIVSCPHLYCMKEQLKAGFVWGLKISGIDYKFPSQQPQKIEPKPQQSTTVTPSYSSPYNDKKEMEKRIAEARLFDLIPSKNSKSH